MPSGAAERETTVPGEEKTMWFDDAVVYQIYPLGLCGAPLYNDD